MTTKFVLRAFTFFTALAAAVLPARSEPSIIVQSTTSTANSGLYDHLLPAFERDRDIKVRVVAVGTGQAIRNARNCDGDVLLVQDRSDGADLWVRGPDGRLIMTGEIESA